MFCTNLRVCLKLKLKVQKVLMRWSNSPEIGLSSSFWSPLYTNRILFTSHVSQGTKYVLERNPLTPTLFTTRWSSTRRWERRSTSTWSTWPLPTSWSLLGDPFTGASWIFKRIFSEKVRAFHLWTTTDQSALCSLMKELSRKTDGADGEYFLPGETRGDFWAGGIWTKMNKYSLGCTKMH